MKKLLCITSVLAACASVRAGDASAPAKTGPAVDLSPASTPQYVLKHRSSFNGTENDHNPFWPIGWVKTEAIVTTDEAAPTVPHAEDFTVTTILLNDPPMAVINGKDIAEGEVASINVGGRPVVVQLMAVQDGRVTLRWQNQDMIIPIHRDEQLSAADRIAGQGTPPTADLR